MTRTAFVLSGGASLGAVQVGMLQALAERGIQPDLYAGSSVGALNACYAASNPGVEGVEKLAGLWRSIRGWQVFPPVPLEGLLGLVGLRNALVSSDPLRSLLRQELGSARLERLHTPALCIATGVLGGRAVVLSEGSAADAAAASSAIPGVYPPVTIDGHVLMDGGVSDNTPIDVAIRHGAGTVYVLPTGFACALTSPPGSALGMALHALTVLVEQRLINDLELYEQSAEIVVLPPPCPLTVVPVDFSHTDELIRQGYELAKRRLSRRTPARHQADALRRRHARNHGLERGD